MAKKDMAAEGITPEQLVQSLFRNREAHEKALSRVRPDPHPVQSRAEDQEPENEPPRR